MKRYEIVNEGSDWATDVEEIEKPDGEWVKAEDCEKLITALKDIERFGKNNPGCGFSCHKVADEALKAEGL